MSSFNGHWHLSDPVIRSHRSTHDSQGTVEISIRSDSIQVLKSRLLRKRPIPDDRSGGSQDNGLGRMIVLRGPVVDHALGFAPRQIAWSCHHDGKQSHIGSIVRQADAFINHRLPLSRFPERKVAVDSLYIFDVIHSLPVAQNKAAHGVCRRACAVSCGTVTCTVSITVWIARVDPPSRRPRPCWASGPSGTRAFRR